MIVEAYSAVLLNPLCTSAEAMLTGGQSPWIARPFPVPVH